MIESKGYKITPIDGDLAVSRNAEIGGDADIHGKARVAGSLKVEGFLDAPHIKGAAKGLFNSVEELTREYPNPRPGWFAIVLDATNKEKGILYKAENRGWVATTDEAKPYEFIKDSINVFASKGELADETQRAQSAEHLLTQRIVNETVRATEAENEIKKDAVKFSRLGIIGYADKLELMAGTIDGDEVRYIDIPAATETKAGVVSAEDKKKFVKSITWNNDADPSNMNDFVVAGVYEIKGIVGNNRGNLPIMNTGENASFAARLVVTVSPEGDTTYRHSIGQTMVVSNSEGKETKVYTRNANVTSYDGGASYVYEWGNWGELQKNVNVDAVTSLDHLVDNGIYSGVLTHTGETFVLVVINNYALASQYGTQKCISQFKYSVSPTGAVAFGKRVKIGNADFPDEWEIINKDEVVEMIGMGVAEAKDYTDNAINSIINGAPEAFDTLKEIAEWITNDETGAVALANATKTNAAAITAERTRAIGQEGLLNNAIAEEKSRAEQAEQTINDKLDEEIDRSVAADQDLLSSIDEEARRATKAEGEINQNTIAADSLGCNTTTDDISFEFETLDGKSHGSITFPAATTETAGVMSAEDKKKLDINTNIALLDITRIFPTGGTNGTEIYADLKAALNVVPSSSVYKKNIKFLTFRTSDTTRELWQFDGVGNDTAIAFDDETKWHKVDPDMFWDLEFSTDASNFSVNQNATRTKVPYHSRKKGMIIRYTDTRGEEYVEIYHGLSNVSGVEYYNNFIRLVSYQTVFDFKKHEGVEGNDCLCIKEVFIDKYTEGASYRFLEGTISSKYPTGYFRLRETLNDSNTDTYVKPTLNENGISEITTNTFHAYIIFDWNKFDTTLGFVVRDILFTDSAKTLAFSPMIYAAISVANLDAELRPLAQTGAGLSSKLYAEQELIYENLSEQAGNKDYQYTNIGLIHRAEERQTFNRIALNFRAPSASYANTGSIVVKTVSSTPAVGRINNAVLIKQIDGVNNMDFPSSGLYTIDLDYNVTLEAGECLIVYYTNYVKIRTWEPIDTDSVDRPGWYFQGEYRTSKGSSAMTLSIKKGDLVSIEDRVKNIEEILGVEEDVEEGTITEPLVTMIDDLYVPVGVKQKFYYNEFIYGDESTVNNTLNWRIQTKINSSSVGMKCVADEEGFTIYSHTAGDYILTITIYDSMKNQKWQGNVNLHIFQPQSVSGKNILMLGASWIDINSGHKGYTPYINDALQEIGINLNFIGTRDAGTSGLKHEGIGGYGYQTFVTAPSVVRFKFYFDAEPSISKDDTYSNNGSTYQLFEKGSGYITMSRISGSTEPSGNTLTKTSGTGDATITFNSWTLGGSNPLWNTTTNKLDFTHYRRDLCGLSSPIDFCVTQLGVNDSLGALKTTKTDWQPYLDAATTLFDEILRDSPNCKIVVGLGAMGAPGTTGWSGLFGLSSGDKRTFQMNSYYLRIYLNETIKSRDDYKQNVFIGQSVLGINRWHGYLHYDAREIYCKINADASVINQLKSYNFQDSQPFAYLKDSEGKKIIGATNIVRYDRRGYIVLRKWSGNWDSFDYEFVKKDVELPTSGKIELHNKSISGMPTELNFTECNQEDNNSAEHVFTNATHPADLGYRQMAYCAAWQVAFLLK